MDAGELRQLCLALPGSFEDFPFGPESSVFKVRAAGGKAKMFALTELDGEPLMISLKCEPELALQLRAAHPEITGAWHMNKTHWNQVEVASGLPHGMIRDMVEDSYDLVVASLPRRDRESLAWKGLAGG
ncbi:MULTISPECIES: MmcQ/YjbR family DNA-binding protein [unclassified Arthrobacter]|uniref:MmcQ/YjbR family DNA-binding protein n=1 Tax=unclassified Arthrobacter TaxID=235627 RepID=UPI001E4865A9|nr:MULTISPECIES: MmcQ/YjbR family DNA-binding protein [unclassified Arthrobacter]MCC9144084.1 MmcQ/YjbR family DNA-binding protein [Arthrobacter sp. zg-Y919]MDK1275309.1 MmcQ/YjbR family DNA-binding protein [Arthrobacter sp. zg.Y919]WIB03298.1 MmcQ/YjbR family DNA-binding protein [Arthrobacter sp. zg-Y919]